MTGVLTTLLLLLPTADVPVQTVSQATPPPGLPAIGERPTLPTSAPSAEPAATTVPASETSATASSAPEAEVSGDTSAATPTQPLRVVFALGQAHDLFGQNFQQTGSLTYQRTPRDDGSQHLSETWSMRAWDGGRSVHYTVVRRCVLAASGGVAGLDGYCVRSEGRQRATLWKMQYHPRQRTLTVMKPSALSWNLNRPKLVAKNYAVPAGAVAGPADFLDVLTTYRPVGYKRQQAVIGYFKVDPTEPPLVATTTTKAVANLARDLTAGGNGRTVVVQDAGFDFHTTRFAVFGRDRQLAAYRHQSTADGALPFDIRRTR